MESKRKRISGFAVTVIVLAAILLTLIITGAVLFVRNGYNPGSFFFVGDFEDLAGGNAGFARKLDVASTPIPNPNPTPTVNPSDRIMPELDGKKETEISNAFNPIPDVFEKASPSVVGVIQYRMQHFNKQDLMEKYATGSGFVVSSSGYILTNAHLLEGAQKMTVLLPVTNEELEATVIGSDSETDIAVLKVTKEGLKPLPIGDSDAIRVGDFVLAIGNPVDLDSLSNTLTFGVVSAKSRSMTIEGRTNNYIQMDAAVNFGNSGGPLLNLSGEVVGMTSMKTVVAGYDDYGNAVNAEGLGFALPMNDVIVIMKKLIEEGTISRPAVGISVITMTEAMAAEYDLPMGVYVQSVVKGGPASQAGIKAGDVIVSANGTELLEQDVLIEMIRNMSIGDSITLGIVRDGENIECTLNLGNKTDMDFDDVDDLPEEESTPEPSATPIPVF